MNRVLLFYIAWAMVGGLIGLYLLIGSLSDCYHWITDRKRQRVLEVLGVVLFESDSEADAAHGKAGKLPTRALLAVIQTLAFDLNGQARDRLRNLIRTRGLQRHICRRARSRRWRLRIQAAQLQYLLDDGELDRNQLVLDRHPMVQARAVESLTADQAATRVPLLLSLLDSPDMAVRRAVKRTLLETGTSVVPDLVRCLSVVESETREDPAAQRRLLEALEIATNLPDSRLVVALQHHCEAEDPLVRRMAVRALSGGHSLGSEAILVACLTDSDADVRVAALQGLQSTAAVSSVAVIGRLMRDRSWHVRRAAGAALDGLGSPGRLILRSYLADNDAFARDMARQILDARAAQTGVVIVPSIQARMLAGAGASQ